MAFYFILFFCAPHSPHLSIRLLFTNPGSPLCCGLPAHSRHPGPQCLPTKPNFSRKWPFSFRVPVPLSRRGGCIALPTPKPEPPGGWHKCTTPLPAHGIQVRTSLTLTLFPIQPMKSTPSRNDSLPPSLGRCGVRGQARKREGSPAVAAGRGQHRPSAGQPIPSGAGAPVPDWRTNKSFLIFCVSPHTSKIALFCNLCHRHCCAQKADDGMTKKKRIKQKKPKK